MTRTHTSERTLPAGIGRPDVILGVITALLVIAVVATVAAPYAAMPTLAAG
ncbi:hypothetical protein HKX41_12580, partial [Salinisphaera sp. USBA-960]|nr:hypothetical protein [Salifodinibacter halophilus]